MKKLTFSILAILSLSFVASDNNIWVQKADFGGGKIYDAATFVIGNYAYVATGSNNAMYGYGLQRFMYRYDPSLDVWKRMADLPPAAKATKDAIGFSIGSKGYVCGGLENAAVWEYDPQTNLWYQRANFPRAIEEGIGFAVSSKAYAGLGGADIIDYRNDFYEFDPSKNKWTQLNDFPGAPRRKSIGFSMEGKGYVGLGYKDIGSYNKSYFKDLWEYDPLTDDWVRLPDFPGDPRADAIGFGVDGAIYIGMGGINDFYKYDLKTKEWSTLNYMPGSYRVSAFSFCIGSGIYYGGGMSPNMASDMWKYTIQTESTTGITALSNESIKLYPNPVTNYFYIDGINKNAMLIISDINGKIKLSKNVSEHEYVSIDLWPKGLYFVTITTANSKTVRKLLKN